MAKFTPEEKTDLASNIEARQKKAQEIASYNQCWDIVFKLIILVIGLGIIVCSAIATSETRLTSAYWSLASTILGGAATTLSAFAFTQFDFAHRQRIHQKKADAFAALAFQLKYLEPEKEAFVQNFAMVDGWNDYTPLEANLDGK